jgi:hypothetical protein
MAEMRKPSPAGKAACGAPAEQPAGFVQAWNNLSLPQDDRQPHATRLRLLAEGALSLVRAIGDYWPTDERSCELRNLAEGESAYPVMLALKELRPYLWELHSCLSGPWLLPRPIAPAHGDHPAAEALIDGVKAILQHYQFELTSTLPWSALEMVRHGAWRWPDVPPIAAKLLERVRQAAQAIVGAGKAPGPADKRGPTSRQRKIVRVMRREKVTSKGDGMTRQGIVEELLGMTWQGHNWARDFGALKNVHGLTNSEPGADGKVWLTAAGIAFDEAGAAE